MGRERFIRKKKDGGLVEISCRVLGAWALLRPEKLLNEVIVDLLTLLRRQRQRRPPPVPNLSLRRLTVPVERRPRISQRRASRLHSDLLRQRLRGLLQLISIEREPSSRESFFARR